MKLLWLGTSNDVPDRLPAERLGPALTAQRLEAALGTPIEVDVRRIWPSQELPGLVDGWLDAFEPDLVFLKSGFLWFAYESIPRRAERLLGPIGRPFGKAGLKVADTPWLAHNRPFQNMRRLAQRVFRGDTPFTPDAVIACQTEVINRVLRRESVTLVVSAAHGNVGMIPGGAVRRRAAERRDYVDAALSSYCRDLHVPYWGLDRDFEHEDSDSLHRDGIHFAGGRHEEIAEAAASRCIAALQS